MYTYRFVNDRNEVVLDMCTLVSCTYQEIVSLYFVTVILILYRLLLCHSVYILAAVYALNDFIK